MTRAYLALGGNLGDVAGAFAAALQAFAATEGVTVVAASRVFRTAPWGVTEQPDFLNMAVAIDTDLAPRALLDLCLRIEKAGGRVRDRRWGPRSLDIDVIACGDAQVDEPELTIPHPRAHERAFVLAPLADVGADVMLGAKRVREWLASAEMAGVQVDEDASERVAKAMREILLPEGEGGRGAAG